ncbi:ZIP family metal transporter [Paenisporosarcina quisquiliarum]|uniref:ZIP family metal transporter n=1 Tax=Paenisporosarcina quisquiliarum TaxID=365346 RepID=UPI003734FF15
MAAIWVVGYLSTATGFGIGGMIAWMLRGFQKRMDVIYSICAGSLLGMLSFEIAPEALELGNWITFSMGFVIGVIIFNFVHSVTNLFVCAIKDRRKQSFLHSGILLVLSISFHNLPIGIVLGANQNVAFNKTLLQTIILHNIPEGIIVFTPLFMAGFGIGTWLLLSLVIAFPVGIGAYFGKLIGVGNPLAWSLTIGLAVGTIYMITIKEVLSEPIKNASSFHVFVLALLGFVITGWYFLMI